MEEKEHKKLLAAIRARDPRYDGRVYYGVKTTGIYCRPICSAKPRPENIKIYRSQAEAESHGYRPCLRCRPDLSPLSPQWRGTEAVIGRALEYIKSSPTDVVNLANRVGLSDRHLRRLFQEHVGASPVEIALATRLHFARQLLSQSNMKIIDVVFASGFQSSRRFNDAFIKKYKQTPRSYRNDRRSPKVDTKDGFSLEIPVAAHFDFNHLLNFFKRHQITGVEAVSDTFYERHFRKNGKTGSFKVEYDRTIESVKISARVEDSNQLRFITERVRRLFDLSHNPHQMALPKSIRGELKKTLLSARIPGSFDPFETAVCIILGQLVSVAQAQRVAEKLVSQFGEQQDESTHSTLKSFFPSPETLAKCDLASLGLTKSKAAAIRELAKKVMSKEIDLEGFDDFGVLREKLLGIKGIGPWTAEMIAMRCLRDPDAWPGKDLIISRAVEFEKLDVDDFSGWRAYLAVALWKLHGETLSQKKGVRT